ncbi:MAG: GNAT family protein [Planctomycetota bacterium]
MNPLLLDIPEQIETDRLVLRLPHTDDADGLVEAVQSSIDELHEWMSWAKRDYGRADAIEFTRRALSEWQLRKTIPYRISLGDQIVGSISLFDIDWDVPSGEIGYWLRSDQVGRGLMTEACNALTDYALDTLNFNRVVITCSDANQRSYAVAERCGYTLEAVQRNARRHTDGTLDHARLYSRTTAGVG